MTQAGSILQPVSRSVAAGYVRTLLDALRDLSWAPAPGYLLAIDGFAGLQGTRPQDLQTLVEVLDDAVRWWAEAGVPFWAFLAPDSTPRNTGRAK